MRRDRGIRGFVVFAIVALAAQLALVSSVALADVKSEAEDSKKVLSTVHDQLAVGQVKRAVVLLTGGDALNTRVLQDALSIELEKIGWDVVSRLELEKKVTRDWEQWAYLPDSLKADTAKVMNDLQIAKLVSADALVTGTVLFGRHQYGNLSKEQSASSEKVVITALSFQIVDVARERTILEAVVGYINGKSAPYAAEDVQQLLQQYVKK